MVSKFTVIVKSRTACHPNPALGAVCTWLTSNVVFCLFIFAGLRSGGSSCLKVLVVFVFDLSRLLGGPSPWSGVVSVTVASGCVSTGSCCLSLPCWSMFHPRSGMQPCGIRFLAVLPLS